MAKNNQSSPAYENVVLAPNEIAYLESRNRVEQASDSTLHFHEFIEIIYFKKIKGHVILNQQSIELKNNSVLFIPTNTPHAFNIDGLMELHLYQCSSQLLTDQGFKSEQFFPKNSFYAESDSSYWQRLQALFDWYFQSKTHKNKQIRQDILKCISWCFWEIIEKNIKQNQAPSINREQHFFKPFIESVDHNLQISLEEAASLCCVTRSHFSRKFKTFFGMSFSNFLEKRKIQKAKSLLLHTNLSMTEIAHQSGFNDSSYFSSTFKKHTKMKPLEMRKQLSSN